MAKVLKKGTLKKIASLGAGLKKSVEATEKEPTNVITTEAHTPEQLVVTYRARARKLARSILRKWSARLELEEVDSIVDLSLCEAAKKFDTKFGASFMTFLFYHLRGNLIRSINYSMASSALAQLETEFLGKLDGESGQLAYEQAAEIMNGDNDRSGEIPEQALMKKEMIELSQNARDRLDELAKVVLERIYLKEEQLVDIACSLGYSRCHISRVKRRALEGLYDDLKGHYGATGPRPSRDDEDDTSKKSKVEKVSFGSAKKVFRRRPRSKSVESILGGEDTLAA